MTRYVTLAAVGVAIGSILAVAQHFAPALFPWVVGYMIACMASNIRRLAEYSFHDR